MNILQLDIMASKCKIVPLITKELPAKYAYKPCTNTRPTYIARITHTNHTLAAAHEFDKVIDNGITSICSYPTELPTRAKTVRGLLQMLGGLSISKTYVRPDLPLPFLSHYQRYTRIYGNSLVPILMWYYNTTMIP